MAAPCVVYAQPAPVCEQEPASLDPPCEVEIPRSGTAIVLNVVPGLASFLRFKDPVDIESSIVAPGVTIGRTDRDRLIALTVHDYSAHGGMLYYRTSGGLHLAIELHVVTDPNLRHRLVCPLLRDSRDHNVSLVSETLYTSAQEGVCLRFHRSEMQRSTELCFSTARDCSTTFYRLLNDDFEVSRCRARLSGKRGQGDDSKR